MSRHFMQVLMTVFAAGAIALAWVPVAQAQPHTHHEDESPSWLQQWGETIQMTSVIVLLLGITVFVAIRLSKAKSAKAEATPSAESPGGQDPNSDVRPGMTLVELLVVLVILVVLTTVAIQSITGSVDQSRYDATQQTLQNIQNAILGQRGSDGNLLSSSFVADMGRLPLPVYSNGVLVGDPLAELWDPTAVAANSGTGFNSAPFTIPSANSQYNTAVLPLLNTAPSTNLTVIIPSGWRGPYLQLPVGNTRLLDGWAFPLQSFYQAPGSNQYPPLLAGQSQPVNVVCSFGSDSAIDLTAPSNHYTQDQYVPSQTTAPPNLPLANFSQLAYGTVSLTVQAINTNVSPAALTNPYPLTETTPKVRVVLFAPVNGAMTTFILDTTPANASYNPNSSPATYLPALPYYYPYTPNPNAADFALTTAATTPPPTTPVSGTFYNVPIGQRAVQAFQYDAATMVITKRSPLIFLKVSASSVATTLILQ